MPKAPHGKSRRLLMQGVLFLVFCASVGLAALVTHAHVGVSRLAGIRYAGSIGARLPKGWALLRENQGFILFYAKEPDLAEKQGRTLTIRKYKVDPSMSVEDFYQSSGLLNGTNPRADTDESPSDQASPITIAKQPGLRLTRTRMISAFFFGPPTEKRTELYAAAVWPTGLALSVQLDCPDDSDLEADQQTLRDVAEAMAVQDPINKP